MAATVSASPKNEKVKEDKKGDLNLFPMATSMEKTESWTADTVKFTTGLDVKPAVGATSKFVVVTSHDKCIMLFFSF